MAKTSSCRYADRLKHNYYSSEEQFGSTRIGLITQPPPWFSRPRPRPEWLKIWLIIRMDFVFCILDWFCGLNWNLFQIERKWWSFRIFNHTIFKFKTEKNKWVVRSWRVHVEVALLMCDQMYCTSPRQKRCTSSIQLVGTCSSGLII